MRWLKSDFLAAIFKYNNEHANLTSEYDCLFHCYETASFFFRNDFKKIIFVNFILNSLRVANYLQKKVLTTLRFSLFAFLVKSWTNIGIL